MMSSGLIAMRRGRLSAFGSTYSLIASVSGSIWMILFVPKSQTNGTPFVVITMPYGFERSVGVFDDLDLAGLRIEAADDVRVLRGEQEHAVRREERRVRIAHVVRQLVFGDCRRSSDRACRCSPLSSR